MIEVRRTEEFRNWFERLRDTQAKARILARITRASTGNLGDVSPVGGGVGEMRLHFGPGYRIYFTFVNDELVILLCGGDKGSQQRDIQRAQELAKEL